MRILTIDQGTTSTRGVLFDEDRVRLLPKHAHRQNYPRPGWVEHDPLEILDHIETIISAAGPVDAVGLTHQGESCMAWCARTKAPLSPLICWQDNRTIDDVQRLRSTGVQKDSIARCGLPLDPYFSASKLAWLVRENHDVRAALSEGTLRLGTSESFFNERLTDVFSTDVSTASRTGLFNINSFDWDSALCTTYGVPQEALPPVDTVGGKLFQNAFLKGTHTPLLTITDQPAALYGHECLKAGMMKATLGTGAFILAHAGSEFIDKTEVGLTTSIAWQMNREKPVFAVDGAVYNAASAVNWARSLGLFYDFSEIDAFTGPPAIERGLVFVPALSGLAAPHWDRSAAGLWWGLGLDVEPLDLARSVLEGVALRCTQIITALNTDQTTQEDLYIDGGLSQSQYLAQFLADATGKRVATRRSVEMTAFGCADIVARAFFQRNLPPIPERGISAIFEPQSVDRRVWMERFFNGIERSRGHSEIRASN